MSNQVIRPTGYTLIPVYSYHLPHPKITDIFLNEREIEYLQRNRHVSILLRLGIMPVSQWKSKEDEDLFGPLIVRMVDLFLMRDYGHIHQRTIVTTNRDREVLEDLAHERECDHWDTFWEI